MQLNAPAKQVSSQCQMELSKLKSAEQFAMVARDGLITTRRQAQDFKNVLLRFWSEQAQTMQSRLSDRNIEIQSMTKTLETLANASNEHVQIVETVKSEGVKVSTTYASAIKKLEPANPLSIFTADEHAKGIDIAIFRALETLVSLTTINMENQRNQVLSNCH
jgi:gas vesicle protein